MNTPTDQLEAEIDDILNTLVNELFKADTDIRLGKKPTNSGISTSHKLHNNAIQRLLALIHTREQQARIDELQRAWPHLQKHYGQSGEGNYYYDDRLATLNKEVTNEQIHN